MAKRARSGGTPATVALEAAGLPYSLRSYDHDPSAPSYGLEAARALGVEPASVFKTLIVEVDGGGLAVGIVPVDRQLDLKAIASALGAKKAAMAEPRVAERATGYVVGGISPIGQKRSLATVLDSSAADFETIFVSGGRRGLDLELSPDAVLSVTRATLAAISR